MTQNPATRLICFFWYNPILLAFLTSASLLLGAYGFQYLGGYAPCDLCWYQRYAHMAILGVSGLFLLWRTAPRMIWHILSWGTLIAFDLSLIAAGYHAGVEQKWWPGPQTCTNAGLAISNDIDSLFDTMMKAPMVPCDVIPWTLFGLSMAAYNFLISLGVGLFIAFALYHQYRKKT